MQFGLFIEVAPAVPFAPEVAGCLVLVGLSESEERGRLTIEASVPEIPPSRLSQVLAVVARFVTGEQFAAIDFDGGDMPVKAERGGERRWVRASVGCLLHDGGVEEVRRTPK